MRRVKYALIAAAVLVVAATVFLRPARAPIATSAAPTTPPSHRVAASARPAAALVYVSGAVARPGLYRVAPGARANDAVRLAGGLLAAADPDAVNLAAHVGDGDQVLVPHKGDSLRVGGTARTRSRSTRRSSHTQTRPVQPVDVNAATAEQLARVPGIGKTLAGRIVALREQEGPFADADALLDVSGMTPQRLERARDYILFYH